MRIFIALVMLAGTAILVSAPKSPFTQNDKAYYADERMANYIRPGLVVTVLSAEVASDGTVKARVRFTDPKNAPLDKDGIQTPGTITASAVIAYIPKGQAQYVSYVTRSQTSPITGATANQATSDSGGVWQKAADGEYIYTSKVKLPSNYEKGSTHAIGVYANRNLQEFDFGIAMDDSVYVWVPDGSSKPVTRDVVRTQSCRRCHNDTFAFHGTGGRTSVEMCVLCHTPQTTDPDTGNSVDLPVMIHKIHMGADLPSVKAGGNYQIIGHNQTVADFSGVGFPTDKRNCTICHEQTTGATQAMNYLTRPTRAACGACHDNVDFNTGKNHDQIAFRDDTRCSSCHMAQGLEFDLSVSGAHTVPLNSKELGGIDWAIVTVDDGAPGKKPTVTFTLKDKAGNPLAPSDFARLYAVLGGPTTDYTTKFAGAATSGYVSEDLAKAAGSAGTYSYTFNAAIPNDAKGTFSVSLEGRRLQTVNKTSVQYGAKNAVYYFTVDGTPVQPRRTVVKIEKCQQCHFSLRMHGENRVDTIEHCVVCHNPVETDAAQRPPEAAPVQSIDFRQLIHNIHGGEKSMEYFGTDEYVVYGYGKRRVGFGEVKYPGRLATCDACHVNGSQQIPLPKTNAKVSNPRGYINPSGPETAACLSCHLSKPAASHALTMTSSTLGEGCSACHGASSDFNVLKVHAAPSTPVSPE